MSKETKNTLKGYFTALSSGMLLLAFSLSLIGLAGCQKGEVHENGQAEAAAAAGAAVNREDMTFTQRIEAAHAADTWYSQEAVQGDMELVWGGNVAIKGTMTLTPSAGKSLFELGEGRQMGFDGTEAWTLPDNEAVPNARFHALTWPYFLAVPYKLDDPGCKLEDLGDKDLADETYHACKLSFAAGTGDAPDDWYVLFRDNKTDYLAALVYIVTYGGQEQAKAEEDPHAVVYGDYVEVQGVPVPTSWTFYGWTEEAGLSEEPLGKVSFTNPRFVEVANDAFAKPEGATVAPLAGA